MIKGMNIFHIIPDSAQFTAVHHLHQRVSGLKPVTGTYFCPYICCIDYVYKTHKIILKWEGVFPVFHLQTTE
jgi:hypothetical protein